MSHGASLYSLIPDLLAQSCQWELERGCLFPTMNRSGIRLSLFVRVVYFLCTHAVEQRGLKESEDWDLRRVHMTHGDDVLKA